MAKDLILADKQFIATEAFNSLRTNLLSLLSSFEGSTKTICFTSPEEGNGSSLNCVNIAASFAQMGAKVLLIDTDMRNPSVHRFLGIASTPGLSECLLGKCVFQDATVSYPAIPDLTILPAGNTPAGPTELILSARFNQLLKEAGNTYDYVFIDAPPACQVTDAAIISQKTLGAILVCRSGYTKSDVAKKAKRIIEQGGGKIIGTILNGIPHKNK